MSVRFTPVRGTEAKIATLPYQDGAVYFATDTNKIYLDSKNKRIPMGGSGASFYYISQAEVPTTAEETGYYIIYKSSLIDEKASVAEDDILMNTDGIWYRVHEVNAEDYSCIRMAVSGGGGGGGGGTVFSEKAKIIKVDPISNYLINGRSSSISIYAISGRDTFDGTYLDERLTVYWTLSEQAADTGIVTQYAQGNFPIVASTEDEPVWETFEYGTKARFSTHNILKMYVKGSASEQSREFSYDFFTSELTLSKSPSFDNVSTYDASSPLDMQCIVGGTSDKMIFYYFDDVVLNPDGTHLSPNITSSSYRVPANLVTHGSHKVRIELYQYINGKADTSAMAAPIEMEIAIKEVGNNTAIIWLGSYQEQYYQYDSIKIPFRVYDPLSSGSVGATVNLFKESNKIGTRTIPDSNAFSIWEIVDADLEMKNYYTISCGEGDYEVRKEIQFYVAEDPNRAEMKLVQAGLRYLFDASGRSNSESVTNRTKCVYGEGANAIAATFEGFNWYNNGWITDPDTGNTCLRISNGATFKIPLKRTIFASTTASNQSHTFEFQFKVRNVQDYSNIVHNVTRYQGNTDDRYTTYPGWIDDEVYATYNDKSYLNETWSNGKEYDNYDAFLQWYLPAYAESHPEYTGPPSYDDIEYRRTDKILNTNYASAKYFDSAEHGICLGAQDALFTNGPDTVNVSYVEDKLINLTIVYSHGTGGDEGSNRLMSIYLNGMLTGVTRSNVKQAWSIGTDDDINIVFNSQYCDFDLYKVRVYSQALTLPAILVNYTVDLKDPIAYDLTTIATVNNSIGESQLIYDSMINYNAEHPDGYIMPYLILTTKYNDDNVLPFSKSKKIKDVQVEFVNTGLERAYTSGELGELAERAGKTIEEYYKHHCPSWKADHVEMSVQGTSSEFYPRRNYKAKTKNAAPGSDVKEVQMYMNRGPFTQKYLENDPSAHLDFFYYDNDTVGTTKFTLKIDYMESSGTYNMGFANLVKNAYNHHPLYDYYTKGAFQLAETEYNQTTTYEEGTTYWYVNHKGNWKNTVDDELKIANAEDFALGPVAYAQSIAQSKVCTDDTNPYYNKWYTASTVYVDATMPDYIGDYRTSVQGFPVLTFHQTTDVNGNPTGIKFIGRYNMLLDKGSDEAYGFKPAEEIYQKFIQKKGKPVKVSKVAECWEAENNSRGFCSFRDASTNRTDDKFFDTGKLTSAGAPVVADYWEYRYHNKADSLDILYDLKNNIADEGSIATVADELGIDIQDITPVQSPDSSYTDTYTQGMKNGGDALLDLYSNWERAVRWVYSTDQDAVPSAGTYQPADVGIELYAANTYYLAITEIDENDNVNTVYRIDTSDSYDILKTYYKLVDTEYKAIKLCGDANLVYAPNTFYISTPLGDKVLDPDTQFSGEYEYFTFINDEANSGAEPLAEPVVYNGRTYNYDTKEYRNAKFTNDLTKHFNIEYLVTYFVMTEVFECYDSRGKNCMFASWGPQQEGGDYIWYPIFYDIDTQLGINNTGIPSFEYYVDATENGTFSTNDSLLWNNLYKNFRSQIIQKYRQLRDKTSTYGQLTHAPLKDVDRIEKWYLADPDLCNSIAMRGERPLIALNLDEYYKYISITNTNVKYQDRNGGMSTDNGTYFYALQGNRSLSRQQFLTNRLNYIDSWLNQGNYERGGSNIIRGRIAANSPSNTSDKWIEGINKNTEPELITNEPYWADSNETIKNHVFDGEYWITMEPVRNSYVTVGTDAANFPSLKYTNLEGPVKFITPDLENGVRTSGGYHEQLYYIYGLDQMKSLGDMSTLYWTEFNIEGSATKMVDLLLGYDGLDESGAHYRNSGINMYGIHASNSATDNGGMPLLKKINLSYITFNDASPTYNFNSCEKLEDFRAVGSNITNISFAEGVALHTLYLPSSIKILNLTKATKLNNIVTELHERNDLATPPVDVDHGLYIPGLTDVAPENAESNIEQLFLIGDCLGYDSYKLLTNYYSARHRNQRTSQIMLTDVDWTPYKLIDAGTEYVQADHNNHLYWVDDGHYGFKEYENYTADDWNLKIKNGELYKLNQQALNENGNLIKTTTLLENLRDNAEFVSNSTNIPIITGTIFINNDSDINESIIANGVAAAYPELKFFFAHVEKVPAARYIVLNDDGTYDVLARRSSNSRNFPNPKTIIGSSILESYDTRTAYDFYGWSAEPLSPAAVLNLNDNEWWTSAKNHLILTTNNANSPAILPENQYDKWNEYIASISSDDSYDYTFYAVYDLHSYLMTFVNGDGSTFVKKVGYGEVIKEPTLAELSPYKDDSELELTKTYKFAGWSLAEEGNIIILSNYRSLRNYTFYAQFTQASVYDNVLSKDYFIVSSGAYTSDTPEYNVSDGITITLKDGIQLKGKITLPVTIDGSPVSMIGKIDNINVTHIFFSKSEENKVRVFNSEAFNNNFYLVYVEFPKKLRSIMANAFTNCNSFGSLDNQLDLSDTKLAQLSSSAFSYPSLASNIYIDVKFPGSVEIIQKQVFSYNNCYFKHLTIGSPTDPISSNLILPTESVMVLQSSNKQFTDATLYVTESTYNHLYSLYSDKATIASKIGISEDSLTINLV